MAVSKIRARKQRVFRSVFESEISQPTPTPPATREGVPFGGPSTNVSIPKHVSDSMLVTDQVRWDRAWHVVTSRILLPSSVAAEDSFGMLASESQDSDATFYEALALVLNAGAVLPHAAQTEDILLWHTQQVRQHFANHVLPLLSACAAQGESTQVLFSSIRTLEAAHRQYLHGLSLVVRGFEEDAVAKVAVNRFQRDLHAIIGNSWTQRLSVALWTVLQSLVTDTLWVSPPIGGVAVGVDGRTSSNARENLLSLVESLQRVGLAGEKFQILFAEIMDSCMKSFVLKAYAGVWEASSDADQPTSSTLYTGCIAHLCDWVESQYGRLAVEVFSRLGQHIEWNDVERWKEVAIGRLATLRIHELFDIVLHWPRSRSGLEDLRSAVTSPERRLQLTDTFSAALQKRLLHSGRSTLDILQTYISMIRTFHVLDHSKVLLDRVVHALQLYLCQRDDVIRIVVTGLLSNPESDDGGRDKTKLVELATILNESSKQQRRLADEDDLDWNDMTWVPDPVDAGVNYKRPKNEDVIGTLISALGAQDIFIKEFQLIIAERLLSAQTTFAQEVKVLALLKQRFGDAALQNCDVMMRDIQDSKRLDATLCKDIKNPSNDSYQELAFHSKILSRLFWPTMAKESFQVPPPIASFQGEYEIGFEDIKTSRKLTWIDQLGSATVHLEFEDRSLEIECKTCEASVIYAFQDEAAGGGPVQKNFNDIWQQLMIDEDLLESALKFWVSKRVLRDNGDQNFVVIENLDSDATLGADGADRNDTASEQVQPSTRKPKVDVAEAARRGIYWQFIVGMLTNSGPSMPLPQILMMMKMLIPDGCAWTNEELQEFLAEKIAEGELELVGGKYRLIKK